MPQHISSLPPSPITPGFQHQRTPPIPVSPSMVDPNAYHRAYVFMPSPESQAHVQLVSRSNRPPQAIPTGFQHHLPHLIPVSLQRGVVYGPSVPEPPCPQVPLCFQPYLVPRENLPRLRIPLGFRASSGYPLSAPHGQVYADGSAPDESKTWFR
ncbi:hypothetical protein BC629DRAFT_1529948 [Irpex lacteus]|nr:hypothetical protein BC629DRAFT_1529948 [Irpex lacteus]